MTLTKDERNAIIAYRTQKAYNCLIEVEDIRPLNHWNIVANRLYYACYYMASALLIKYGFFAQTHKGVIHLVGLHFITKGILSREQGRLLSKLFEMRQSGDYDDLFDLTAEEVEKQIEPTYELLDALAALIANQPDTEA